MQALVNNNVHAFAADQIVLIGLIRDFPEGKKYLHLAKELFSKEPFALAVARGDADFRLVADRALSRLYRSGRIKTVYAKWFPNLKPPNLLSA